jgi:transposase
MDGSLVMGKNEQFRLRIIDDFRAGRVSRCEAATLLGVTERTIARLAKRVREKGPAGIKHGNYQRRPSNVVDQLLRERVIALVRDTYFDCNLTHCRELLLRRDCVEVSYMTLYRWVKGAGLPTKLKKKRPRKDRIHRERMANAGLLLQMDGSHDAWNGKDKWCLIGLIDDATSEIASAAFFPTEDTECCMQAFEGLLIKKGIPEALYVDKAGWFGGTKRTGFGQFERACEELGTRVIYANSPEAKGRIERAWRTFQDRLKPELRLESITSMEQANAYLHSTFLPEYWNERLTVVARDPTSRYRPLKPWIDLREILCLKEERFIRRDRSVSIDAKNYRVVVSSKESIAGRKLEIRRYRDGSWSAFLGRNPVKLTLLQAPLRRWREQGWRKPA